MVSKDTVMIGMRVGITLRDELVAKLNQVNEKRSSEGLSAHTMSSFLAAIIQSYLKAKGITAQASQATQETNLPIYNAAIHKAGDRVLIKRGDKLVPCIVPSLDGDGHVIP